MNQQDLTSTREITKSSASTTLSAISPSFTTYSNQNLADIAARVVHELNLSTTDPYDDDDDFYSNFHHHDPTPSQSNHDVTNDDNNSIHDDDDEEDDNQEDSDSEFEFAVLGGEDNTSPISADEIFYNGQIRPTYPVFDTSLVYGSSEAPTLRLPLRRLLKEDGHGNENASCSSSEGDELEGVPEGTYCVWAPQKREKADLDERMMIKKKSKSTGSAGSSKRWRFRDLLHRSNSDGKDAFVFLAPHHQPNNHGKNVGGGVVDGKKEKVTAVKGKMANGGKRRGVGEEKKKSYLPYRQDLVGLFANVNGLSHTVRPF